MGVDREKIVQIFFFAFLGLLIYELYRLISPFLSAILWAMLLAFIFHPLLVFTHRFIRNSTLAAAAITAAVSLLIILPALWLSALLASEGQTLYASASGILQGNGLARLHDELLRTHLIAHLSDLAARHGIDLDRELLKLTTAAARFASDVVLANFTGFAKNVAGILIDFGVLLVTFFYLMRDGERYYEFARSLTPLHEQEKRAVFETLRQTLSSVMRGLLVTALVQGFAIGAAFAFLGVPYWAFLSVLTAACGLLPFGGTGLVWVPASVYLFYAYGWGRAIALAAWGAIAVGSIDNVVKPYAMGHGTGLPTLLLFFGLFGGLEAYGPIGLFLGPAVISVLAALLRVYRDTYSA